MRHKRKVERCCPLSLSLPTPPLFSPHTIRIACQATKVVWRLLGHHFLLSRATKVAGFQKKYQYRIPHEARTQLMEIFDLRPTLRISLTTFKWRRSWRNECFPSPPLLRAHYVQFQLDCTHRVSGRSLCLLHLCVCCPSLAHMSF